MAASHRFREIVAVPSPSLVLLVLLTCTAYTVPAVAQRAGGGGSYREAPAVNIPRQGLVSGVEVPLNKIGHRAWTYLGIPFARPPVGDLRFAPPDTEPPPSWNGVRNGSTHMPACIPDPPASQQHVQRLFASVAVPPAGQVRTSEDCLYLNIYRPEGSVPEEKFPVMVWFHPGDFHWGAPTYWDASVLAARHKVIVVTTAYRLNILGFYADNTADAAGNWGLLDQVAALDWVQRNIDGFGGSARDVTLFGQGSGAVSVGLHLVSPMSRDKFQRAISMSGTALGRGAVAPASPSDGAPLLDALADKFNCFRNTLTGCLRNVDAELLVRGGGSLGAHWGPVVDGPALSNRSREPFLPDTPTALMDDGRFAAVAHMVGYNHMEGAFELLDRTADVGGVDGITMDRFEALVRDDVADDEEWLRVERQRQQQQQQQQQLPTVATDESAGSGADGGTVVIVGEENCTMNSDFVVDTLTMRYARHTDDPDTLRRSYVTMAANKAYGAPAFRLAGYVARRNAPAYVYRYEYKLRATKALPTAAEWMDAPHGAELPAVWGMPYWAGAAAAVDWTAADRRMADVAMALWTNFARHADPAHRAGGVTVRWDEFQPRSPRSMVLDKVPNMSMPDQEPEFWNRYYPRALAVALHCCPNITVESAAGPARHHVGPLPLLVLPLLLTLFSTVVPTLRRPIVGSTLLA